MSDTDKLKNFLKYNFLGRIIKVIIFPFAMLIITITYIIGALGCVIFDLFDPEKDWLFTISFHSELHRILKDFNPKF